MAFFDDLSRKAKEAAQGVAKKSGELVEVTKLNVSISSEEDKIKKIYAQIGKKIYESYRSDSSNAGVFTQECEKIDEYNKNIEEMKNKILDIKNIKECTQCGIELKKDSAFCPKCGAKQEEEQTENTASQVCTSCGAPMEEDSTFCASCGTKNE